MRLKMLAAAAALLSLPVVSANATTFELTFTQVGTPGNGCCGPFDVTAYLQATPNGNNFDITAIAGTVTQDGTSYAITGLIAPPNDPGDYFDFDNIIFSTGGVAPFSLDTGGIGFYAAGVYNYYPADPAAAFNVWGDGGSSATLATTASYDVNTSFNGNYIINVGDYSLTETPLPASWTMMLLGLAGLGCIAFFGQRRPVSLTTA
jgi:hypothetical protein